MIQVNRYFEKPTYFTGATVLLCPLNDTIVNYSVYFERSELHIWKNTARAMNQAPVSCIPNSGKMSKAKKVIDEAKEIQNPELDLADKGIATFEEMPGLCE